MTLDQIYMRLTTRKVLRKRAGARAFSKDPANMPIGPMSGRTASGQPIRAEIREESLAARKRREAAERRAKEAQSGH